MAKTAYSAELSWDFQQLQGLIAFVFGLHASFGINEWWHSEIQQIILYGLQPVGEYVCNHWPANFDQGGVIRGRTSCWGGRCRWPWFLTTQIKYRRVCTWPWSPRMLGEWMQILCDKNLGNPYSLTRFTLFHGRKRWLDARYGKEN